MSDVFVRDEQMADVKFYIRSTKDNVKLVSPENYSKLISSDKVGFEECHVFLKPLTWGKSCHIRSNAYSVNPMTNGRVFDHDRYIQMKLKAIISGWSFTVKSIKGDDVPVQVTEENIDALHPLVAEFILDTYNERFELTEEARKNS